MRSWKEFWSDIGLFKYWILFCKIGRENNNFKIKIETHECSKIRRRTNIYHILYECELWWLNPWKQISSLPCVYKMNAHLFYISINVHIFSILCQLTLFVDSRHSQLKGIQSFQFDAKPHIIIITYSFCMMW